MTFGLITEGLTDQWTIDNIINGVINHDEEIALITPLCPMDTEPSGWTKVFSYLKTEEFRNAFREPGFYAVIHLDTGSKPDWVNYFKEELHELARSIPNLSGGENDKIPQVIEQVKQLIRLVIGPEFYDTYKDKMIFAIAVNDIECWHLAIHATAKTDQNKIVNCLKNLNEYVSPKFGFTIAPNNKGYKDGNNYRQVIKDYLHHKTLMKIYKKNPSLNYFVEQLIPFIPEIPELVVAA